MNLPQQTAMVGGRVGSERPARRGLGALRVKIANWITRPAIGRLFGAIYRDRIPNGRVVIDTRHPLIREQTKAQLRWGIYESAEIRFVNGWLRRDLNVVELGSSLGVVGSHIARVLNPDRRMVCVEAHPALCEVAGANIRGNAPGRELTMVCGAIHYGDSGSEAVYLSGSATEAGRVRTAGSAEDMPTAPIRLSELLREHQVGPYALVCDIEGAEAGMLDLDADALATCEQIIIELHDVEWRGKHVTPQGLRDRLTRDLGFVEVCAHGPVSVFNRPRE